MMAPLTQFRFKNIYMTDWINDNFARPNIKFENKV